LNKGGVRLLIDFERLKWKKVETVSNIRKITVDSRISAIKNYHNRISKQPLSATEIASQRTLAMTEWLRSYLPPE